MAGGNKAGSLDKSEREGCVIKDITFTVGDPEKEVTVYDCSSDDSSYNVSHVYLLGNSSEKEIKVKVNREVTGKCPQEGNHKKVKVFGALACESTVDNPLFRVKYDRNVGVANFTDYIFLPINDVVSGKNTIKFTSCANTQEINVIVYPNIKYSTSFSTQSEKFGENNDAALSLSYEYDGQQPKVNFVAPGGGDALIKLIPKLFNCLGLFKNFTTKVPELLGVSGGTTPINKYIEFNLKPPQIELSFVWQYDEESSKYYSKIGRSYKITLALTPLIGGEFKFHLVNIALEVGEKATAGAAATGVGAVIPLIFRTAKTVKEISEKAAEKVPGLEINFLFVDAIYDTTLNLSGEGTYSTINPTEFKVGGEHQTTLALQAGSKAKNGDKFELEVSGTAGISLVFYFSFTCAGGELLLNVGATLKPLELKLVAAGKADMGMLKFGIGGEYTFKVWDDDKNCKLFDNYKLA